MFDLTKIDPQNFFLNMFDLGNFPPLGIAGFGDPLTPSFWVMAVGYGGGSQVGHGEQGSRQGEGRRWRCCLRNGSHDYNWLSTI